MNKTSIRESEQREIDRLKHVFSEEVSEKWEEKAEWISSVDGNDNLFRELVDKYVIDNQLLLDVGCGTGKVLHEIDCQYNDMTLRGIELSEEMAMRARRKQFNNATEIVISPFEQYTTNERYDIIMMRQILHHISDKIGALRKAETLLSNKGVILVMVPNERYQDNIFSFTCSKNDPLGRLDQKEMQNTVSGTELEISEHRQSSTHVEFNNMYDYFMFMYSIGSLQKLFEYHDNQYTAALNLIEICKRIFEREARICTNFSYSYYVLKRKAE